MIEFDDLTDVQQQALVDAFGEPDEYQPPKFSKVDDPVEAAGYEVFRDSLEGVYVEQGDMSDERFDSYKSRGILREEDDGEIVVNSVWRDSQVEELQENGMVDFDAVGLYESSNRDDMVVMDTGEGFKFDIRDGSLTYELPGTGSVNDAEYESGEKVEEITEDFVRFFASVEEDEAIDSIYPNTRLKPGTNISDGGDKMTEDNPDYSGDELDTIVSNVRRLKESLEGMGEDEFDVEGVQGELDDYIDQVENLEGQLRELQSDIDDLEGELEESEEAFEHYQEVLGYANDLLFTEEDGDEMGLIPELESRMGGLGTDLDEIYDKIDSAYDELRDTLDEEWGSDWDGMADETASRVQSVLDNGEEYVEEIKDMHDDFYDE